MQKDKTINSLKLWSHSVWGCVCLCVCVIRKALQLARQLKDRAVEAQACYSLGNTYTLLHDYERAIDYHLKHLIIAQDLNDRWHTHTHSPLSISTHLLGSMNSIYTFILFYTNMVLLFVYLDSINVCFCSCRIGEGRACWSLGNAHTALGNHDQAMHFAEKHLEICKEVV